jgi:cytidine diphosphoramidate kinase
MSENRFTETVYWITGLSGAGKTTFGKMVHDHIKKQSPHAVFLDGDELRKVFGGMHGHSIEDRKILAGHYSRLCKMLSDQGIIVVCSTVAMFDDVRSWNRANIERYTEVYIRVPMDELKRRDQNQIYSKFEKGEVEHVMGLDLDFEEPKTPDLVLDNDGSISIDEVFAILVDRLLKKN